MFDGDPNGFHINSVGLSKSSFNETKIALNADDRQEQCDTSNSKFELQIENSQWVT